MLDDCNARAYCVCSRCGWGLFEHVYFASVLSFLCLPLFLGDSPIYNEILSQRVSKPKTTNQTSKKQKVYNLYYVI